MILTLSLADPPRAFAEQASQPGESAAAHLDAGRDHSCALLFPGSVRCWGFGGDGRLGYGNLATIGDDETPGSVGPANLGIGREATALSAGDHHTCALLMEATVRCWGSGAVGQLGYGNTSNIGDNESAGAGGPVALGGGARAITAGEAHTCAILNRGEVRCWGYSEFGELGYPGFTLTAVGDDELPDSVGPVELGAQRSATAVSAARNHTCALLDDRSVRCWGANGLGQLGYPNRGAVGDDETPGSVGPVDLGVGARAKALTTGAAHTCAILEEASVRCWGSGSVGQLGYASTQNIGDNEPPGSAGPVDLGKGRTAKAIAAGDFHTCALLDDGSVRCWGFGGEGRLGYGRSDFGGLNVVGDNEAPGSVGPVDLGLGRTATAISAGSRHTCARLDDGNVRCWGYAAIGQLGNCTVQNVGDDEVPGSAAPVALELPAGGGSGCLRAAGGSAAAPAPAPAPTGARGGAASPDPVGAALRAEAARLRGLHSCSSKMARHARREARRARRLAGWRRSKAKRHIKRHRAQLRRRCLKRFGRTPGRVTGLRARAVSSTEIVLNFKAAGSDGSRAPAARNYLVKQSRRPIRSSRAFRRAQALCEGSCRFPTATGVGRELSLTISDLHPSTTYYYAVAARDNVSRKLGPRASAVSVRTP